MNLQKRYISLFLKLVVVWISIIIMGSTHLWAANPPQTAIEKIHNVNTIALLPFQTIEKEGKVVSCPICGKLFRGGDVPLYAEKRLTNLFYQKLNALTFYRVLQTNQTEETISKAAYDELKTSPLKTAIQIGKELNADAVLVGYVYRYQEREGYAYSVRKPASVAFEVHLISLIDNKGIWEGYFDETQKSLSENVLKLVDFIKTGGKWLTADELAEHGVEKVFNKFPGLKKLE
ncbi:MAG: hypothetical protein ABIJ37_11375 [Pseudomonadota bacterium]